jgi:hypothetical protein
MPARVSTSGGDVRVGALERGGPHPRGRSVLGCAALAGRGGHQGGERLMCAFLGS